jgi:hypothetical protein
MIDLITPIPCADRTEAQHALLAAIIGAEIDEQSAGVVGPCRVKVADLPAEFEIAASVVVPSQSEPGLYYAVAVDELGAVICPCKAGQFRANCSHGALAQECWALAELVDRWDDASPDMFPVWPEDGIPSRAAVAKRAAAAFEALYGPDDRAA